LTDCKTRASMCPNPVLNCRQIKNKIFGTIKEKIND
jgi:hypothetical protein